MSTDKEEESFYRPSNIRNQMLVHGGLTFKRAKAVQLSNISVPSNSYDSGICDDSELINQFTRSNSIPLQIESPSWFGTNTNHIVLIDTDKDKTAANCNQSAEEISSTEPDKMETEQCRRNAEANRAMSRRLFAAMQNQPRTSMRGASVSTSVLNQPPTQYSPVVVNEQRTPVHQYSSSQDTQPLLDMQSSSMPRSRSIETVTPSGTFTRSQSFNYGAKSAERNARLQQIYHQYPMPTQQQRQSPMTPTQDTKKARGVQKLINSRKKQVFNSAMHYTPDPLPPPSPVSALPINYLSHNNNMSSLPNQHDYFDTTMIEPPPPYAHAILDDQRNQKVFNSNTLHNNLPTYSIISAQRRRQTIQSMTSQNPPPLPVLPPPPLMYTFANEHRPVKVIRHRYSDTMPRMNIVWPPPPSAVNIEQQRGEVTTTPIQVRQQPQQYIGKPIGQVHPIRPEQDVEITRNDVEKPMKQPTENPKPAPAVPRKPANISQWKSRDTENMHRLKINSDDDVVVQSEKNESVTTRKSNDTSPTHSDCVRQRVERRARLSAEEAVCDRLSSDIAREHHDSGTVMPQLQIQELTISPPPMVNHERSASSSSSLSNYTDADIRVLNNLYGRKMSGCSLTATPEASRAQSPNIVKVQQNGNTNSDIMMLNNKKRELIASLTRKVDILVNELSIIDDEITSNNHVAEDVRRAVDEEHPQIAQKIGAHIHETEQVTCLIVKLQSQLSRIEAALGGFNGFADEQRLLIARRTRISAQLNDAQSLQTSVHNRTATLVKLMQNIGMPPDTVDDYAYCVHMMQKLLVDKHEMMEKLHMGREQLSALQQSL